MGMIAPILVAQISVVESVLGFLAVVLITFFLLSWVTSFIRFQDVLGLLNSEHVEESIEADSVLQLRLAKFLTESGREQIPFHLLKCSVPAVISTEELVESWKSAVRVNDWIIPVDEKEVYVLLRCDREDVEALWSRLCGLFPSVATLAWQGGVASFPENGVSGRALIAGVELAIEASAKTGSLKWAEDIETEDETELEAEEEQSDDKPVGGQDILLDPLTGVLRDRVLSTYMHRQLSEYRLKKKPVALFCVGVDNMEQIRSFHGEEAHDQLLIGVSDELQSILRSEDMIGRHDKYGFLILVGCDADHAEVVAQRVCSSIQKKVCLFEGKRLRTTTTVGVSLYPEHGKNLHVLYSKAQNVVDYCRENDIRGYAYFNEALHRK